MGMYDRDWYREERRQQRQSKPQQPATEMLRTGQKPQEGPPSVFSVKAMFILGFALIAALIILGFA